MEPSARWLERRERWPPEPSARASATMISMSPAPRLISANLAAREPDETISAYLLRPAGVSDMFNRTPHPKG
jgi:hypothetical protein